MYGDGETAENKAALTAYEVSFAKEQLAIYCKRLNHTEAFIRLASLCARECGAEYQSQAKAELCTSGFLQTKPAAGKCTTRRKGDAPAAFLIVLLMVRQRDRLPASTSVWFVWLST